MNLFDVWYREDEDSPWLKGRVMAWSQTGEALGDYKYVLPCAIILDEASGQFHGVALGNLSLTMECPEVAA